MRRRGFSTRKSVLVVGLLFCALVLPLAAAASNWPAYLFGSTHQSYAPDATQITPANAPTLVRAWRFVADPPTRTGQPRGCCFASPTVFNGRIYVGANTGDFYALSLSSGQVIWKRFLGFVPNLTCGARGFTSTATVAADPVTGALRVYVAAPDGYLYALKATDGSLVWRSVIAIPSDTVNDYYNWSSPAVANGRIYVGISSQCDNPLVRGGVKAFAQATGSPLATYHSVPEGRVGGSVWSSPAATNNATTDNHVIATTGNWPSSIGDSESIVRLDAQTLARQEAWRVPTSEHVPDGDFGGSPTIFAAVLGAGTRSPMVGACNKNGIYYAFRLTNLAAGPVWRFRVSAGTRHGKLACLASAIWNGSNLFVAGTSTTIGGTAYKGSLRKLDPATGQPVWQRPLTGGVIGSPSLNGAGVLAVATFDESPNVTNAAYLLRASTGAVLRRLDTGGALEFAQPVFVNQYVLLATISRGLFAYKLP
jgi:outer membrane protein assembly factor BamB